MPNVILLAPAPGILFAGGTQYSIDPTTLLVTVPSTEIGPLLSAGYLLTALAPGSLGLAELGTDVLGSIDGLGMMRVARATFDPTGDATMRTVAAHGLGVTIPDKAVVCGGFMQVVTAPTSTNSTSTIAIKANAANDISTAAAVSGAPWSTAGLKAITPKANTPESTGIALTAAREITATVAVEALLGGKVIIFLYYLQGA